MYETANERQRQARFRAAQPRKAERPAAMLTGLTEAVAPRREFIEANALRVANLDV